MTEPAPGPVLVTGAAGFIGFHLAEHLLRSGVSVVGIDSMTDYYDPALKEARLAQLSRREEFSFERLDVREFEAFGALVARVRPRALVHLAAQAGVRYSLDAPRSYTSTNVEGFLSVLEACRHTPVGHLVYASSSSVYGLNTKTPFSEHDGADHPVSLYAATKRANELMAHAYAHLYGIAASGLRFFTVYGPWGRPDMAYFKFTKAILENRPIEVHAPDVMRRDFTYIDDIVEGIARLLPRPPSPDPHFDRRRPDPATAAAPHRIFNIGNNAPVDLRRFIAAIEAAAGRRATCVVTPLQPGDVEATCADVTDLAAAVGFAPSTSIEAGIGRFVAWYRDFYAI
jgi:UDP-glucuronate 4-epimerase